MEVKFWRPVSLDSDIKLINNEHTYGLMLQIILQFKEKNYIFEETINLFKYVLSDCLKNLQTIKGLCMAYVYPIHNSTLKTFDWAKTTEIFFFLYLK